MTLAIKKNNTNRWPLPIPFRFDSSLTDGMKDEIKAAIADYERLTQARFDRRPLSEGGQGGITFVKDNNLAGCGISHHGRSTSEEGVRIRLRESCSKGTALHEIGHAIGLFHEHNRPNRDSFVTVNEENIESPHEDQFVKKAAADCVTFGSYDYGSIMHYDETAFSKNGKKTIEAPEDVGQRDQLSSRDLDIVRRLMPSNAHVVSLNGNGTIGNEATRYNWNEGWSVIRAFRVLSTDYLFTLRTVNGIIHINRLEGDGTVGLRVDTRNWKPGWTVAEFFRNGLDTFVFLLKTETGQMQVRRIDADGAMGDKVDEDNWSSGWTTAAFYTVLFNDYGLFMKKSDGTIHIHKMEGGKVKGLVSEHELPRGGWKIGLHFNQNLGVDNRMFFLRHKGEARVQQIAWDGKLGDVIEEYDWSQGWSTGVIYERDGFNKYLLLLKASNGTVHVNRIRGNGKIGARVGEYDWSAGWTAAAVVGNRYLYILKEAGRTAVI